MLSVTVLISISDLNNPQTVNVGYKTSQSMTHFNSLWDRIIFSPSIQLSYDELGQRKMQASVLALVFNFSEKLPEFIFYTKFTIKYSVHLTAQLGTVHVTCFSDFPTPCIHVCNSYMVLSCLCIQIVQVCLFPI